MNIFRTLPWILAVMLLLHPMFGSTVCWGQNGNKTTVADLGQFDSPKLQWQIKAGSNINLISTPNAPYPDEDSRVLKLALERKGASEKNSQNWFYIQRDFTAQDTWQHAQGIGITLALNQDRNWWLCINIWTTDDLQYDYYPITPNQFTTKFSDRWIVFGKFKPHDKENKKPLDPTKIKRIRLSGSGNAGIIYLKSMQLYQTAQAAQWIEMKTQSRYGMSIFERDEPVELSFDIVDAVPSGVESFVYQIKDFEKNIVQTGTVKVQPAKKRYVIKFANHTPGYFEVQTYAKRVNESVEKLSCLRSQGSVPGPFASFAVLPTTVKENIESMFEHGQDSFFGIHGTRRYLGLNELLGMPWIFTYTRWNHLEHTKPNRKNPQDSAAWVEKKIRADTPIPSYLIPHTSLSSAMTIRSIPKWAQSDDPKNPPAYKNWNDYALMVRDYIRYHKRLAPHVKNRTYGVLWEPELLYPKYFIANHYPVYSNTKQLMDVLIRAGNLIKKYDPEALILGPTSMWCYGFDWWDSFLKDGLLDHVDAVSSHFYVSAPPEANDIPGKLKTLRSMFAQYSSKSVDIYNTEAGFQSRVGTEHFIREHAGWTTRYAMLLKGEGVKMHLQFFPHDIRERIVDNHWSTYGLCFTSQNFKKFDYNVSESQLTPKPVVCALANLTQQLQGAKPIRHIRDWGDDIWGYVFNKDEKPIIAIWQPYKSQRFNLVVGDVNVVTIVDMLGRKKQMPVKNGIVQLQIDQYPKYVHGASSKIYMMPDLQKQDPVIVSTPQLYPGQKINIDVVQLLGDAKAQLLSVKTWGAGRVTLVNEKEFAIQVPFGTPTMALPVLMNLKFADGVIKTMQQWVRIGSELAIQNIALASEKNKLGVRVRFENHTAIDKHIQLSLITNRDSQWVKTNAKLKASSESNVFVALVKEMDMFKEATESLNIRLKVTGTNDLEMSDQLAVYFLAAYPLGQTKSNKIFPDHVSISSVGGSGKKDSANIHFAWDAKYLYLQVESKDDAFCQTHSDDKIWAEDSFQIAFDTDPQSPYEYNPAAGIYNKKITEIAFANTPRGAMVWRHKTHNKNQLPLGNVTSNGFEIQINRDDKKNLTTYDCKIPWQQIGLDAVTQGKNLGISLVVNDADTANGLRKVLELFKGIFNNKNHREYGRIILR